MPEAVPKAPLAPAGVPTVLIRRGRARPLWFGHPWAYANAVERVDGAPQAGDTVVVADHEGRFIGRGLWNPRSQIPVRILTRADEAIDAAFLRRRVREAVQLRARLGLPSEATTAYRLINSEGDGLPGLVVDVYADTAVAQITTLGLATRREAIFDALEAEVPGLAAIYEVAAASYADLEGFSAQSRLARGQARGAVTCREEGIELEVEPLVGQKTGLFLDQRPSRARVGSLARGRRVLDVYAYVGGFSLQAARAGAREVTAVDSSSRAIARITAHAELNRLTQITAVEMDAFHYLEAATPRSADLVIIDPPKFARARKDLEAATKGYERLNALAMTTCAPGAFLFTCSCSQNLSAEDFERIVAAGAKQANRTVRVLERLGPGPDHPLPPGFTEGQYLKVLLCAVE